jgi:hypothetical protein
MRRPSGRELFNKIAQAKEAVLNDKIRIIDPATIAADAIELDYQFNELKEILFNIFEEIEPKYYVGSRPPQKSYKSDISGLELFAFRWVSISLGCEAYIKFSIMQGCIYLVSLHQHRRENGGENGECWE